MEDCGSADLFWSGSELTKLVDSVSRFRELQVVGHFRLALQQAVPGDIPHAARRSERWPAGKLPFDSKSPLSHLLPHTVPDGPCRVWKGKDRAPYPRLQGREGK